MDGWNEDTLSNLIRVMDNIYSLSYEVKNCIRGCYTSCHTYKELGEYVKRLGEELVREGEELEYEPEEEDFD